MNSRILILLMLILSSCTEPVKKPVNRYMDIKGFFEAEISRLTEKNKHVSKTVKRNDISETKNNVSVDWETELAMFIESDINKPAWRDSYNITQDSSSISYTALENGLRTRSINIQKSTNGRLLHISIKNQTKNNLYQSTEDLTYIPDSLYTIHKNQNVLLLGNNSYTITGILK